MKYYLQRGICDSDDPCSVWNADGTENVGNLCELDADTGRHSCTCGHPRAHWGVAKHLFRRSEASSNFRFEVCKQCAATEVGIFDYDVGEIVCRADGSVTIANFETRKSPAMIF